MDVDLWAVKIKRNSMTNCNNGLSFIKQKFIWIDQWLLLTIHYDSQ